MSDENIKKDKQDNIPLNPSLLTLETKNGDKNSISTDASKERKDYDKLEMKKYHRVRFSSNVHYASIANSMMANGREKRETAIEELSDIENSGQTDAYDNLKKYLITRNRNYKPHIVDPEILECPTNNTKAGCNQLHIRWILSRFINHIVVRLFLIMLLILDMALIIYSLNLDSDHDDVMASLKDKTILVPIAYTDLAISVIFFVEVGIRMTAMTPKIYFSKRYWYNTLDSLFVLLSCIFSVVEVVFLARDIKTIRFVGLSTSLRIVRMAKFIRIVRIYFEHHSLKRALRQTVRQNKKGYSEGEHNLDLTYVTKKIIATSFPSEGFRSCYRNNIIDVARFLDEKHGIEKFGEHRFWVYNLCSEMTYDETVFHDQVRRVCIPDHNVPTVAQMIAFVEEANKWLEENEDNVVVIHCKGGKGRTGTMICILNLYRGIFRDAETSLSYFGDRRTDERVDDKFQGVETASQIRYVSYYEKLMRSQGKFPWMPENWAELKVPDIVPLKIVKICITGINSVGEGNGTDLTIIVQQGTKISDILYEGLIRNEYSKKSKTKVAPNSSSTKSCSQYCDSKYFEDQDYLEIDMKNCPSVSEDVRIKFQSSSSKVKNGYEWCAFYFWFHTSFLEKNSDNLVYLKLKREEIDNPHKPKRWKELGGIYPENFCIELVFEKS